VTVTVTDKDGDSSHARSTSMAWCSSSDDGPTAHIALNGAPVLAV